MSLFDYTGEEIECLIDYSAQIKQAKKEGKEEKKLCGKNIVLIFEKDSTRTRCSFEVAAFDQGAHVTYIGPSGSNYGVKESVKDTARVLGRYYDGIQFRGFKQSAVEDLAKYSGVPVWNGLTDDEHPTQMLADFLTMKEHLSKPFSQMKIVYSGDGRNNVALSILICGVKLGADIRIVTPKELFPQKEILEKCQLIADQTNAKILITDDVEKGVLGADIIYTDVWVSLGEPQSVWSERIKQLKDYQVNKQMFDLTKNPNCLFMHCLPAFHDLNTKVGQEIFEKYGLKEMEVSDEVFEGKNSIVFDQAENRMHTIKALMIATMCGI